MTGSFSSPSNPAFTGTRSAPLNSSHPICSDRFACGEEWYRICVKPKAGMTWQDVASCADVDVVTELEAGTP
ncbi:MAG: hypothetical protein EYC70_15330 [Planctomycetota bacterium]|nr:MAG: hypothetical protein EYC70_15330 [Planctomycetota bacterium]